AVLPAGRRERHAAGHPLQLPESVQLAVEPAVHGRGADHDSAAAGLHLLQPQDRFRHDGRRHQRLSRGARHLVTTAPLLRVEPPTFEHHRQPMGIGESAPRLSWRIVTDVPGWRQRGYEIEISDETGATLTATGIVESGESVLVPWPGAELCSR